MIPRAAKTITGTKFEYGAGNAGVHPPRNSSVATHVTVSMLAYSAMKKAANVMLLYSTWKPATSSFSASGKSNGTRFVSAKAAIMKMMKLNICGKGPEKIAHFG